METAIRWSPTSTTSEQRFLYVDVAGKSFKLCRVTNFNKTGLTYDVLSSHTRVPAFRAFDWSPENEALVAIGQSSGEATILRMDDDSQSPIVFPIRNQRYCNAVAFSTRGLLATGLDKVRNDFCLNIWDVNQRLSVSNTRGYGSDRQSMEPVRKLASSEPITSIKFFRDQPDTLVAGVKGQFVRIYDLRESPGNPSMQFPTRCVHNLAIDWLDENYIASCYPTNDSLICIWDRRSGSKYSSAAVASTSVDSGQLSAALEFRNVVDSKSSIWSLRFSRTKRGCLGMLSSKGTFKAYDIAKDYVSDENRASLDQTLGQDSAKTYAEQIYTKGVRDFRDPLATAKMQKKDNSRKVASFDFLNFSSSNEPSAVTLLANKSVAILSLPQAPSPLDISSQAVMARGGLVDASLEIFSPLSKPEAKVSSIIKEIQSRSIPETPLQALSNTPTKGNIKRSKGAVEGDAEVNTHLSSREKREKLLSAGTCGIPLSTQDALSWMSIPRLRCKEGYLLDDAKNKEILSDDQGLQELWDWIGRARANSSDESMIIHGTDMTYLGVYSIWTNRIGQSLDSRMLSSDIGPDIDISHLVKELVNELGLLDIKGCASDFREHRQLCLRICGSAGSTGDLEAEINRLVEERQHTKAAALAIFQDESRLAYLALRKNQPTQAHKLLAMAITGASRREADPDWEETCAEIAKELTDPYGRAILALVSKGDWNSVIQEVTLPLRYRVEVALRWLPDKELSTYLRDTTAEAVRQGDIEGVVLTGLDYPAMDLFQSYINKFGEIQTPVLAMSHTVPRFINDPIYRTRFESWRETYRRQINSWKMHLDRAKFDVESRKLAATWDGRRLVKPPAQQVSLTCNYCTRPLSQQDGTESPIHNLSIGPEVTHATVGNPLGSSAALSGTVCPKCGRHMPRCGLCSLWLGTPDPMSRAAVAEDTAKKIGGSTTTTAGTAAATTTATVTTLRDDIMRRFVVFCINCNHGFHADHARDWFRKHRICPVAECNCICDR
ncbi:hypothetical protein AJ80_07065 [Polytolypa hystricis UAMH7299]|uniref:Uncharacterized protein n=1 Tax=Polytolypa hystricis (strain UAMH7299) TaxID=1447883 RepID=A0A2B7XRL7_POLH7|nr:hypothetical protein AJ80_07065 [Polytolypa hystricis UAMH7299]